MLAEKIIPFSEPLRLHSITDEKKV